jgi:hypothetical protein
MEFWEFGVFFNVGQIFKLKMDRYKKKKSKLAVVKKLKDLAKIDFFPFKFSITHTFTT